MLQNLYDIIHLILGMLPHYLGKLKIHIFADVEENANKCIFNFVIHPQILIFSVFKIARLPLIFANKIFHVTVFFTFLPRCMQCRRGIAMRILSVCPSVRLSVRLSHACIVTKRKKDLSRFLYHTKDNLA